MNGGGGANAAGGAVANGADGKIGVDNIQGASAGHTLSYVELKSTTIAYTDVYFQLYLT